MKKPLDPGRYPKGMRWRLDFDDEYLNSLSKEELQWLENFARAEYGGERTSEHSDDQMREIYRTRYKASKDAMNHSIPIDELPPQVDHHTPDPEETAIANNIREKRPHLKIVRKSRK